MDKYSYTCHNCGKDYIPKRRAVQKYCSNSCRTRAFMLRNSKTGLSVPDIKKKEPTKIETMSLAGVGNTVAGVAVVKLAESLFTSEANKPATKSDIKNLEAKIIKRYYPVKNMPLNVNGLKPYFDVNSSTVVYFK
ncbi:hypothetical protein [Flavobacterium sp. 83]|uniref:hypothetical protein n=1 Tax=Flavobacterium sp. 83 TaxID=1131812 RepID=UPI0012696528|nr:hypothetical protein [Flavobacterium sp. 83]